MLLEEIDPMEPMRTMVEIIDDQGEWNTSHIASNLP